MTFVLSHWAGQKGVADIQRVLGRAGKHFVRIRVGVGRPHDVERLSDYVLARFSPDEQKQVQEVHCCIRCMSLRMRGIQAMSRAADCVEHLLSHGIEQAMNKFVLRGDKIVVMSPNSV